MCTSTPFVGNRATRIQIFLPPCYNLVGVGAVVSPLCLWVWRRVSERVAVTNLSIILTLWCLCLLYFIVTNIFTYSQAELSSLRPCPPAPENFENKDFTAENASNVFRPQNAERVAAWVCMPLKQTLQLITWSSWEKTNKQETVFEKFHF